MSWRAIVGWSAILLAAFAFAPSFVPGAMSMMGLLLSLAALVISVISVKNVGKRYFNITLTMTVFGLFMVNDGLRLWDPIDMPGGTRMALYSFSFLVIAGCVVMANIRAGSGESGPI